MSLLLETEPFTLAATFLVLSLVLLYVAYPDRCATTQSRPDLAGPRGLPIIGNVLQVVRWKGGTLDWFKHLVETYGPVCTFTMPPWGRGILINRPEWLAHVKQADMVKYSRGPIAVAIFSEFPGWRTPVASEGAEWRLARKAMIPVFTVKSFTEHVSCAMNEIVPTTRALLHTACAKGVPVDWNDLSGRIALAIFTRSALNIRTDTLTSDVECMNRSDSLRSSLIVLNQVSSRRLINPLWYWTEFLNGDRFRFNRARTHVREIVHDIVRVRRAAMAENKHIHSSGDFLSALLEGPTYDDPILIRDTLVVLLFAGRDNTQNSLAWSLHALMNSPLWINRMRAEAKSHASSDGELLYSDLQNYHVHLAVFYETVRLWPGPPKNARLALCDDELPTLPELGLPAVKIEKGDYVFWSDYHMMRDISIWGHDANKFNPGRFLDSDGRFVRPTAPNFNGFGAGPRLCPAAQLAAYEFVACWAGLLPHFDFAPLRNAVSDDKQYEAPVMAEAFTPSLKGPLFVEVTVHV